MRLRSIGLLVLCLVLAFGLAGCKKASETTAEKIVESQTGADVDIDQNKVTVTGEDGETAVIEGAGASLPDGFPSDIPVYDNASIEASAKFSDGGTDAFSVTMKTMDSVDTVFGWHKSQFEGKGWASQGEFNSSTSEGASAMLSYTKDGRVATVGVNEVAGEGTMITYAVGSE